MYTTGTKSECRIRLLFPVFSPVLCWDRPEHVLVVPELWLLCPLALALSLLPSVAINEADHIGLVGQFVLNLAKYLGRGRTFQFRATYCIQAENGKLFNQGIKGSGGNRTAVVST